MKNIVLLLIMAVVMSSCYDDYIKDYEYNGVYFPRQVNARTVVVDEDMDIEIGVVLGGIRDNNQNRAVGYVIDETLISMDILSQMQSQAGYLQNVTQELDTLKLLPSDYYTLSDNSEFVIEAGQHTGVITLTVSEEAFLADSGTIEPVYALPLRITNADVDQVVEGMDFSVVGLKYESKLYGNYWHGGVTYVKDETEAVIDTIFYYTEIPSVDSKAWELTTVGPRSLVANGYSNVPSTGKDEMMITLEEGNVSISPVEGASFEILPDGESTFNESALLQDRKLFLNYKYQNADGNWCHATDTLTFRNRIRDGVNEWMDENPDNY